MPSVVHSCRIAPSVIVCVTHVNSLPTLLSVFSTGSLTPEPEVVGQNQLSERRSNPSSMEVNLENVSLPNTFFSTLQVWPTDVHDSRVSSRNSNPRSPNLDFSHDHDHGHIQDNLNNWELSEIANLKGGAQRVEKDKSQIGGDQVPRNFNLLLLFWLLPLGVWSGGSASS